MGKFSGKNQAAWEKQRENFSLHQETENDIF